MSQLYHFTTHPNQIMSHIMVCTEQITAVSDKACVSGFSDIRKGVFPNALRASCTHVFCLSRTAAEKKKKKKRKSRNECLPVVPIPTAFKLIEDAIILIE